MPCYRIHYWNDDVPDFAFIKANSANEARNKFYEEYGNERILSVSLVKGS